MGGALVFACNLNDFKTSLEMGLLLDEEWWYHQTNTVPQMHPILPKYRAGPHTARVLFKR
jgi:hypothetical protein